MDSTIRLFRLIPVEEAPKNLSIRSTVAVVVSHARRCGMYLDSVSCLTSVSPFCQFVFDFLGAACQVMM